MYFYIFRMMYMFFLLLNMTLLILINSQNLVPRGFSQCSCLVQLAFSRLKSLSNFITRYISVIFIHLLVLFNSAKY